MLVAGICRCHERMDKKRAFILGDNIRKLQIYQEQSSVFSEKQQLNTFFLDKCGVRAALGEKNSGTNFLIKI